MSWESVRNLDLMRKALTLVENIARQAAVSDDIGSEIARRTWSWIGLGELQGTVDKDGASLEVHVAIEWGGIHQLDGKCTITVDGRSAPAARVR